MKASLLVDAPILDKKIIWLKKVNKPFFDHDFHFHKTEEICWIEKGSGNMVVGDYLGRFEEDDFLIFGSGLPHILRCDNSYHHPNSKKRTIAHSIYFTESYILSLTDDSAMVQEIQQYLNKAEKGYRLNGQEKTKAITLIKNVINNSKIEQLGHFLHLLKFLHGCKKSKSFASNNFQLHPSDTDMKRFTDVYNYLLKNFQKHITLSEVSSICSMTTNSFCRFFKSKTQKTFVQFLNEMRIGHATKLLQNENIPIKNLCYECGYNNPVFFHKAFKQITGKTPKNYREALYSIK